VCGCLGASQSSALSSLLSLTCSLFPSFSLCVFPTHLRPILSLVPLSLVPLESTASCLTDSCSPRLRLIFPHPNPSTPPTPHPLSAAVFPSCVGVLGWEADNIDTFVCPRCSEATGKTTVFLNKGGI
jgi:hypothetical protein